MKRNLDVPQALPGSQELGSASSETSVNADLIEAAALRNLFRLIIGFSGYILSIALLVDLAHWSRLTEAILRFVPYCLFLLWAAYCARPLARADRKTLFVAVFLGAIFMYFLLDLTGLLPVLREVPLVGAESQVRGNLRSYCTVLAIPSFLAATYFMMKEGHLARSQLRQEITKLQRVEETLRESEQKVRAIFDSTFEFVGLLAPDGTLLEANKAALDFSGIQAAEVLGKPFWEGPWWSHSVELQERLRNAVRSVASGETVCFEATHLGADGALHAIDFLLKPIKDKSGRVLFMLPEGRDITERKRAEEALLKSEEKLAKAFSASPIAFTIFSLKDGRYIEVNGAFEQITGIRRDQAIGHTGLELGLWENPQEYEETIKALVRQGSLRNLELRFRSWDGRTITGLLSAELIELEREPHILAMVLDLTELKQKEAQLLRMQRVEGVGRLASGVAHDLNNILTPIQMVAGLLSTEQMDAEEREYVNLIQTAAQRGADLVKQLLLFSRGVAGEQTEIELRKLVRETIRIVQETFPKSIRLEVQLPEQLWTINGDATQLHQVLLNLCVNARDAMPEGGTLMVSAENVELDGTLRPLPPHAKAGAYVVLTVTDTGTGIQDEFLNQIFDPFFTTKQAGQGTGLGLSTVHGIVKNHGGFVEVESRVGIGSQFLVYLPASKQAGTSETAAQVPQAMRGRNECILLVDDEQFVRRSTQRFLEMNGYCVITASNGLEAVSALAARKKQIQAVILDLWMPFMDGIAAIQEMQKIDASVKIIAVSGQSENRDQALKAGSVVKAFLPKPWDREQLLSTLHQVLSA